MSMPFVTNLECMEALLTYPNNLSKPNQKWHSAFVIIYCSRALFSHFKSKLPPNSTNKNKKPNLSSSPSYTVIDLSPDHSFSVNQTTLTHLVKEKNVETLQNLGGVHGVVSALNTDVDYGVRGGGDDDANDVIRRREAFGSNTYPSSRGFFHFVIEAFKDPTILFLLVCAALSLGFGIKENGIKEGWYDDGGSIFVAVFIVIAVSSISNFRQNRQFYKLSQVINDIQVDVVRSGRRQQVSIYDIVVGDVVLLKIGDQVPADGLFLEGHSLQVDESSMTGESDHVEINGDENPFLLSGTKVADGFAKMIVTSVGTNTIWDQMLGSISRDNKEETPLQTRLNKLISMIGTYGSVVNVMLVLYFTWNAKDENGNKEVNGSTTKFVGILVAAVAVVLITISKGQPFAVTSTLNNSVKMIADKAMVRKRLACETVGHATIICTDKTGTLTLNQMKVTEFWLGQQPLKEKANKSSLHSDVLQLIQEGVALNSTGSVYKPKSLDSEPEFSGSTTEKAILSWAVLDLGMNMEELTQNCTILHMEVFNSKMRRSGVLIKRIADNKIHVHWKGAAEMVLRMCSKYYDASGTLKDLDDSSKSVFEKIIEGRAASSLRCIAFAYTEVTDEYEEGTKTVKEEGFTLLGLVGIKDPCHSGVKKAVQDCQQAGVNVKMITGDNVFTAKAIATECGILQPNQDLVEAVIEEVAFHSLSPQARLERVEKIRVMAQSSPSNKCLMVQCLKQKGHVVVVTGNDTDDAQALKEADIGLSMGIQSTKIAKESSDIVIMDDYFTSVVTILKWGRCVYNNIQKFIQFQLIANVATLAINFLAALSRGEVSFTTVQLLWVSLLTNTLGALALAMEKPTMQVMDKPPIDKNEPLITNIMWRNLLAQILYQITILMALQFMGEDIFGESFKVNDALIFNSFVFCQVFNLFNARELEKKNVFKGIHENKLFLGIIGITILLQVVMVEFQKKIADIERLNWGLWVACMIIAAVSWPIDWVVKFIPVPRKPLLSP